jgi:hypothetical protein
MNKNIDKTEWNKALHIGGVRKFDIEKFKDYVQTYDAKKHSLDNSEVIVKDMIYGIGLCLDKKEFSFADGYSKFTKLLKSFL